MTWTLAVVPVVLLALGFPIFIAFLAASAVAILLFSSLPLVAIQQVIFGGVDNYALLAVPFFIFAGDLMSGGGISERLVAWVQALVGHVRGSLGLTALGTMTVLGAISGSSLATVGTVGRILYKPLVDGGYGRRFSLGLLTSSGAIDVVIPPSIAMILYAAAAEQSVERLFLAGVLPGLLIAAMMAVYVVWYAWRHGIAPAGRFDGRAAAAATWRATGALLMPVIILAGIYSGLFSPTEAAGVACLYAMLVGRYGYRALSWRQILESASRSAYFTAQILIIVASANVFAWLLTVQGVPQGLVAWVSDAALPPWAFLLFVNLLLLPLGCILEPPAAILVLSPILVPIAASLGIDPVHFGLVMTVNLAIGMFLPPLGLNLYVTQSLFRPDLRDLYLGVVPFLLVAIAALAVVTYVPSIALVLTTLL